MINSHTPSVVAGTPSVTKTPLSQRWAATAALEEVLARLDSSTDGLSSTEAAARLQRYGPNALRTHRVNALAVLGRQLRSVVLGLLAATAVVSYFLGDTTQAIIIGVILAASIGLGFVNEYRAERATAALHSRVHHSAVVRRDGHFIKVDVTDLVPGDVIRLALGETVPADVRLIEVTELECNEGILSGESSASEKSLQPVNTDAALADSVDLAFMGTIVSAGEGVGVVYASGVDAQFGRIAAGLGERQPETDFQAGLRRFSYLLLWVAMTLTVLILVTNLLLGRPVIDSVLFRGGDGGVRRTGRSERVVGEGVNLGAGFDFMTFGLMLGVLHAGPVEFRTGWFVESLATQTLIIFAIRTRRVPFIRSRPGLVITVATFAVVAVGIAITVSPIAHSLGFTTLPWQFFTALVLLTVAYLILVEITKKVFYADPIHLPGTPQRTRGREHRIHRRAARFSHSG